MGKVTIQDIAKKMNLSRNTVSKALSNQESVAYVTRLAVIKKAVEMGYVKLSPQVLREYNKGYESDIKTIAVIGRNEISVFWNSIIMGISDEVSRFGYKLQLSFINENDEEELRLPENTKEADGIILMSVFSRNYIMKIMDTALPIIFLDAPEDVERFTAYGDIIYYEGKSSVRRLTEHLLEQGLTKIGFIGDVTYCKNIKERYLGFLDAMHSARVAVDEQFVFVEHKKSRYYDISEIEGILSSLGHMPEAFVCANDAIALDVIRCLKKMGYNVPRDVAVTGYDDLEAIAQLDPFITTVHVSNLNLGSRLIQQLLWRMEHPDYPREMIYVEGTLLYRGSTGGVAK